MTKESFESLINATVTDEEYVLIQFCFTCFKQTFPDEDSVASYYLLNGIEGFKHINADFLCIISKLIPLVVR